MRRFLLALLFVLLLVPATAESPLVGHPAPAFERKDLNGQTVALGKLRGKVVLLNFWATWCAPCQAEMPTFDRWQQELGAQGLAVVGVSMDDDAAPVRKLAGRLRIHYPLLMGDAPLGERYGGVLGLPLTLLIDRQGRVRNRFQGETAPGKILAALKPLLAER